MWLWSIITDLLLPYHLYKHIEWKYTVKLCHLMNNFFKIKSFNQVISRLTHVYFRFFLLSILTIVILLMCCKYTLIEITDFNWKNKLIFLSTSVQWLTCGTSNAARCIELDLVTTPEEFSIDEQLFVGIYLEFCLICFTLREIKK